MKIFVNAVIFSFVLLFEATALAEGSALQILGQNFKKVDVSDGNLSLTMNDSGRRYLFRIDDKDDDLNSKVLEYGETVILGRGFKKAALLNRGLSITISKRNTEDRVYELQVAQDLRSFGKDLIYFKIYFEITDKSVAEITTTRNNSKFKSLPSYHKPVTSSPVVSTDDKPESRLLPANTHSIIEKNSPVSRLFMTAVFVVVIAIFCLLFRKLIKRVDPKAPR
jgi:hypothetical protein